jgi:hypothetical protein
MKNIYVLEWRFYRKGNWECNDDFYRSRTQAEYEMKLCAENDAKRSADVPMEYRVAKYVRAK